MAAWCSAESTKPVFVGIYGAVLGGFAVSALFFLLSSSSSLSAPTLPLPAAAIAGANLSAPTPAQPETMYNRPIWKPPPRRARMPSPRAFRLTRDMVAARARDGVIVVTFGNYAFLDFILTWGRHLTDLGVDNLLVGAMDTKLLRELYFRGVPSSTWAAGWPPRTPGGAPPPSTRWAGRRCCSSTRSCLSGTSCSCATRTWCGSRTHCPTLPDTPKRISSRPAIRSYPPSPTTAWRTGGKSISTILFTVTGAFNIGIFHWRPTEPAKRLAKDWKDLVISDDKLWDQNAFNDLVRQKFGQPVQGGDLVYSYDGKLKLGVLPASIFCSGPYIFCAGGFLSFKPNIPKSLLLDGAHTVESHFELVNYELKQIRTALAVASLLKRTLVMPPLWCRLDRMWFGHPGILEGTMTRQPFLCPMDHVFEVHVMLKDLPKEEFGPHIDFREYSFLENPSLPKEVKDSLLDVQLCDEHSSRCSAVDETDKHRPFLLPRNSTEEKLLDLLSPYKDVKIIQFSSMVDAFGGFADAAVEKKFRESCEEGGSHTLQRLGNRTIHLGHDCRQEGARKIVMMKI
ncbi:unnamed protein product [Miscanthus lutarioriparius]|uniref:Nucleotide-diphospho-sugar transferase domain-containing protein n=1 Tax=Miscanthus lutarioriparius TaxID=422564 RepID=A0A811SMH6_9POAL|nr:unnamed protein product [Miscanthus lutarioriparius]